MLIFYIFNFKIFDHHGLRWTSFLLPMFFFYFSLYTLQFLLNIVAGLFNPHIFITLYLYHKLEIRCMNLWTCGVQPARLQSGGSGPGLLGGDSGRLAGWPTPIEAWSGLGGLGGGAERGWLASPVPQLGDLLAAVVIIAAGCYSILITGFLYI